MGSLTSGGHERYTEVKVTTFGRIFGDLKLLFVLITPVGPSIKNFGFNVECNIIAEVFSDLRLENGKKLVKMIAFCDRY